jgi:hypothetical protein
MIRVLVATAIVVQSGLQSCVLGGTREESFVIQIDSVEAPAIVQPNTAFDVRFWGTVGSNGCYAFHHFETQRTTDRLDVTAMGTHTVGDDIACTMAIVELRGKPLSVSKLEADSLRIVVHQPNGSTIMKVVRRE